jgi:integrase
MAGLGMRAGEVRQLNLDDIDWLEGVIHVRIGKSRRERTLPLLEDLGKALGCYLQQKRSESADRSIFLTSRAFSMEWREGKRRSSPIRRPNPSLRHGTRARPRRSSAGFTPANKILAFEFPANILDHER